jgi:hypothetical protein
LIIVVEEAHKLLNREMAAQTTFATIARELRKYYVTLLIVDQRPSQIYDEVMSQLGTRISGWLGDEDDIHAVLSGLATPKFILRSFYLNNSSMSVHKLGVSKTSAKDITQCLMR